MKKFYYVISLVTALLAPDLSQALDLTVTCGIPMGHCKGEPTKAIENAKGASSVTLRDLVEKTITANPEVQASYHTYLAAEQEHNAAIGGYLPRIDLISTGRIQERMTPNYNNTQTPDLQTQFVLHQMLFDGFATRNTVNRLGHAARVRYYQIQSAMQNVAMDTVKAYMDTLKYRQFVDYASDNYAVHKQLFNLVEERAVSGVGRRVDLEQANARLNLAEANLLTQTTNLQNVEARYQRLTGELPPAELPEVDFFKTNVDPTSAKALETTYQKNPDILAAIENIIATENELNASRGKYSPRLDLLGTKTVQTSNDGRNNINAGDSIQLTMSYNLFNGFSDKAVVGQTIEKLYNSKDLRDKACRDTRQTLVIAYNDVINLKAQLPLRDQHQLSIEKAREAYRKQFNIGQRTLLDLLDTENEYFNSRMNYTTTERDLATAYARTYAGQGELLSKLGVVRADLPEIAQEDPIEEYKTCQAIAPEMKRINLDEIVSKAKPLNPNISNKITDTPN
jgi:adhesin transport system outer membrane protein